MISSHPLEKRSPRGATRAAPAPQPSWLPRCSPLAAPNAALRHQAPVLAVLTARCARLRCGLFGCGSAPRFRGASRSCAARAACGGRETRGRRCAAPPLAAAATRQPQRFAAPYAGAQRKPRTKNIDKGRGYAFYFNIWSIKLLKKALVRCKL